MDGLCHGRAMDGTCCPGPVAAVSDSSFRLTQSICRVNIFFVAISATLSLRLRSDVFI